MTGLRLETIVLARGGEPLIAVEAHVAPGEVLSVMGPSGSGKSTLLAAVIGTLPPAFTMTGRVVLNGRDVTALPPEDRRIGILYQDELLFPHLSVGGNLAFALPRALRGRKARRARIEAALDEIGMAGFADRDPATLSGGQKARVALMRMLLAEPQALLLDEPFSRLDAALRDQIRALVFARARDRGLPVLLVTHDRADAEAAGGPVIALSDQMTTTSRGGKPLKPTEE
ncbi:ABC transporter ATP-binding protein [Rhodovulum sulfidophilum]|uniref:ATP-binding cassette domain-containing protein n=1 Tax=Rhodovulum visakhapatnamense TaxID=364297 RepID=A0ABS1RGB3_9RHOB|nr:ATP-binding cassette domain-containing protein [Rhodovulum visakhapatnamense]MBL3569188.1 ATP-binding cassette domain-containing protein [Rhodovulum visakhapatnamense]MBL3578696.1 ATP-binding cassette domain-containing protein [Rhodovulum visakhapatnamense]OLS44369.1 ABC transporter ATP-binding protein [Rhodovulum sulfidophilum]